MKGRCIHDSNHYRRCRSRHHGERDCPACRTERFSRRPIRFE
ncbi:putative zinc ribbon protein [Paenibacillus sp. M.A.Huq-82]